MYLRNAVLFVLGLAPLGLSSSLAEAQSPGLVLEEVVVTAQKRAQSLVDVPASVHAISGESLENADVQSFEDLVNVSPSLGIEDNLTPWQKSVYIRGVGTNVNSATVEPSVSAVLDGVVLARQGQFFTDLADIERVEILRGPQSTLFGKNASAGVISILTKNPDLDEANGSVELGYDEYNETRVKGTYTAPLRDDLAWRLSGNFRHEEDSYLENLNETGPSLDGADAYALRSKLLWEVNDAIDVLFIADYSNTNSPAGVRVFRQVDTAATAEVIDRGANKSLSVGKDNRDVNINDENNIDSDEWGLSAQLNWDLGTHSLTSITAYRDWQMDNAIDIDSVGLAIPALSLLPDFGGGVPYFRGVVNAERNSTQFSQELRLQSESEGDLQYMLGAFYWKSDIDESTAQRRELCFSPAPTPQLGTGCDQVVPPVVPIALTMSATADTDVDNEYYAIFGVSDYRVTEALTLSLGIRVQHEIFEYDQDQLGVVVDGDTPFIGFDGDGRETNTKTTGKTGFQYALNDDANVYLNYSRGYKGPGLNSGPFQPVDLEPLDVETVDAWEAGYKGRLMDGRLDVNAAVFWQEFQDAQVLLFNAEDASFEANNAGETRQRGVELDTFFAATKELMLNASVTYLDAEYLDYEANCYLNDPNPQCASADIKDVSGERSTFSPEWKMVLGGRYIKAIGATGLDGFLQLNYRWQSKTQYVPNQDPLSQQDAYGVADLGFGVEDQTGRYTVSFFVKNLTDEHYVSNLAALTDGTGTGASSIQFVPKSADRYFAANVRVNF